MQNDLLQQLFLKGTPPKDLNGFYHGKVEQFIPGNLIEFLGGLFIKVWLPWYGKVFDSSKKSGYNLIATQLVPLIRLRYTDMGVLGQEQNKTRIYLFQTSIQKSLKDPIQVMRLNYDLLGNPPKIRSIVDELVCVGKDSYLGKAYLKENTTLRLIAVFSLRK